MSRHARVTRAVPKGGRVAVEALMEDGTSVAVELSARAGEPCPDFRARVEQALRTAAAEIDTVGRRAVQYAEACRGLTVTLERPGPCEVTVHDGLLEGWVGVGTHCVLVTLLEDGVEREACVTPNKNGRFSVAIGARGVAGLCPVSHDGLCGEEQRA